MRAQTTVGVAVAAVLGLASASVASAETLQIDGFVDGQAAGFQGGFASGEEGAVRLSAPNAGTWKLDNVQLLFGGATSTQTVTLTVYSDTGATDPGGVLFSADYQLTGANDALSEIDLSGDNVTFSGDVRVSIGLQHAGFPSLARDDDGTIDATRNFLKAGDLGWFPSNVLGLTGDWVIRANATEQGGGPDIDAGPSSSDPDAGMIGSPDGGAPSDDTCALNSDCTNGSYCGANSVCTFDCRADIDCASDTVCDEVGRCVEPESTDSGGCNSSGSTPLGGMLAALFMSFLLFRRRQA